MARTRTATAATAEGGNGATLAIERHLWATADKLRGHLDAAEYKHVVLGLIFLKYVSDAFDARHVALEAEAVAGTGADPEDKDEYAAEGVFWVPKEARWASIHAQSKAPEIGVVIDGAMDAIERENPKQLRDVLPKGYARPSLDKQRLGGVVDLISDVGLHEADHGGQDVLGRVYEYFLGQFASAEGKQGGEFYTPRSVVRVLVGMLAPWRGRVYDPCCGSGGLFVQSERFVEAHGGRIGDVSIFGQESNPTTWKLAKMNLALRGIDADLGPHAADTFHRDLHPDLRADYVLANPPFNISDWGQERPREDRRWQFGTPPAGNANFGWVQHIVSKLASRGTAGFVLANGSLSAAGAEGEIRRRIVEADLVDAIVALPGQLFYSTQIPVSLWFLARDKSGGTGEDGHPLRDRRGQTLFIDARSLGHLVSRTQRDLSDDDIARITGAYHAWRGDGGAYADEPGFCRAAPLSEILSHDSILTPGRYVGSSGSADQFLDANTAISQLIVQLEDQIVDARRLDAKLIERLRSLRVQDRAIGRQLPDIHFDGVLR